MDKYDERAAQIIAGLGVNVTGPHNWKGEPEASKYSVDRKALYVLKDSVAAALREAVEEETKRTRIILDKNIERTFVEARASALEEAATICDSNEYGEEFAAKIRERIKNA